MKKTKKKKWRRRRRRRRLSKLKSADQSSDATWQSTNRHVVVCVQLTGLETGGCWLDNCISNRRLTVNVAAPRWTPYGGQPTVPVDDAHALIKLILCFRDDWNIKIDKNSINLTLICPFDSSKTIFFFLFQIILNISLFYVIYIYSKNTLSSLRQRV